jgi:hypothetical protein
MATRANAGIDPPCTGRVDLVEPKGGVISSAATALSVALADYTTLYGDAESGRHEH